MEETYEMAKYLLNKTKLDKFNSLDTSVLYTCVSDRQGGDFALGRTLTIKGWVNQALEWLYMDDNEEDYVFIDTLLEGGKQAVENIDEFWDITIVKGDK